MPKPKLIRITTVPVSLEKLLEGQLAFMQKYFQVIAVSSDKENLKQYEQKNNIRTQYIPLTRKITPIKDLIAVFKLYTFLKKEKPQIVHTHTPKAGVVGMLAAFLAKVPLRLHTVAGLPLVESHGLKKTILHQVEKITYKLATNVYPNSNGLQSIILKEKLTNTKKLKIIANGSSNGIDTAYFSKTHFTLTQLENKKNELGIASSDFVFVFVGRLVSDKGINELVTAFNTLQTTELPNSTLLLVGNCEETLDPLLPKTLALLKNNPKIKSVGWQEDVRIFYGISNVLVFPSYREGFPNVVLQAGAMELPAIVTNINGCNEIITHNDNGLIVAKKDVASLKNAMLTIAQQKDLYKKLQRNTRLKIVTKYQQQQVWDELLKEYQTLVKSL
jgi:glycosyltransferase involved in cell wall biosynthesis